MAAVEFRAGNSLTLLRNGAEYFPALEAAIAAARHVVHLEAYIFADDPTGRSIAAALVAAARRNVVVRVIIDDFGARRYIGTLGQELLDAGVELLMYRPHITPGNVRRASLRRLHRKIAIVDGRVAFVGGINIIDDMNTPGHTPPRLDYAVRVEGPLVEALVEEADSLWRIVAWSNFRQRWQGDGRGMGDFRPKGTQRAALVVRDNLLHRSDIEDAYLRAIETAGEEIILASAYFFPGVRFRHALTEAAQRGVRVVLLLQGRVEFALLHYASRALYGALLAAGVEIVEYKRSFLHAKVAVIDRRWATVGSSNIDPFSLLLAREANVVVDDAGFAEELHASLSEYIESAVPVVPERWHRKPLSTRVRIWLAYGVARFLIGFFGYGGKH